MNEDIRKSIEQHGFWFASTDEMVDIAQRDPTVIPLNSVLKKLSLPEVACNFFVPKYFEQFNKPIDLPVWVWRRLRLDYRPMQIEDFCLWKAAEEVEVIVQVKNIKEHTCEICMPFTNDCKWVPLKQIRKIND